MYLKGQLQLSKFSFAQQLTERAGERRARNTSIGDSQMPTPLSVSYWASYRTSLSLICKMGTIRVTVPEDCFEN